MKSASGGFAAREKEDRFAIPLADFVQKGINGYPCPDI